MQKGKLFFKDHALGTIENIQPDDFHWMEGIFVPDEAFLKAQAAGGFAAAIAGFLHWTVATRNDERAEIPREFEIFFEMESNAWQIVMEDGTQRRISIPVIETDNRITWRI